MKKLFSALVILSMLILSVNVLAEDLSEEYPATDSSMLEYLTIDTETYGDKTYAEANDIAFVRIDAPKYTVTFEDLNVIGVYADADLTKALEETYTTDGDLYFIVPLVAGGTLTVTASSGTVESLGSAIAEDGTHGMKYLLSGITTDTVVTGSYYTGPILEIESPQKNEDSSITMEVSAGYASAITPDGTVIVAAYDENGTLLAVQMYACSGMIDTLIWNDIPTVKTFKAMWWDSLYAMSPKIDADVYDME